MSTILAAVIAVMTAVTTPASSYQGTESPHRYMLVPVSDLLENPTEYFGTSISTRGKVEDVYSAQVFTLEEDQLFDTGQAAIVVVPEPDAIAVQNSDVSVTGVVRLFTRSGMARKYGLAGLADDILSQWERRPVIFAQSVRTDRGAELVAPLRNGTTISFATSTVPGDREARATQAIGTTGVINTKIDELSDIIKSDDKLALTGRPADLSHVRVEHIAGPRSFWVGTSDRRRVFVVVDAFDLNEAVRSERGLKKGDIVTIDGFMERVPGTLGMVRVTSWGRLDREDAKALSRRGLYVYAKRVKLLAPIRTASQP
jgi:hypothetical protein